MQTEIAHVKENGADNTENKISHSNSLGMVTLLIMMASLSLIQGLPAFFFTLGLPAILRDNGASLDVIGLTYVVWLPLALKWIWAPALDNPYARPFGSRGGWLKALTLILAGSFALVAFFPPTGKVWPLLVLSLICSALGATIQIVLAAWLIENTSSKQRALINSVGVAALVLGGVLGAGMILQLNELFSWKIAVWSVSFAIILLSLPVWLMRWRGVQRETCSVFDDRIKPIDAWKSFFLKPKIIPMVLAVICFGASSGADSLVPAILIDKGYSAVEAGWLLGTVATGSIIPATVFIGAAIRRFDVYKVLGVVYLLKAIVLIMLVSSVSLLPETVAGLAIADYCLSGALTVATWQLFMNFSNSPRTATDYSLITALDALLRFCGGIFAGSLGEQFGYAVVFFVAAVAAVGACGFSMFLRKSIPLKEQQV